MKFLVIGLGSMGKRRVRNLQHIDPNFEVYGVDPRLDRREEATKKYGIKTFASIESVMQLETFDAFVISVAPDLHMTYAHHALELDIPCFIEASVVDDRMAELIEKNKAKQVVFCPSCTLRFHPSIKKIKALVVEGVLGKLSHFSYHSGQYLPDWHPWEDINEFYVSKPATGGCREIVPFEMTWLNWVFGDLEEVFGFSEKTIGLNAPIEDTYASVLKYKNGVLGTLIVDVVSRSAIRKLIINGEMGQIQWDWDEKVVKHYNAQTASWNYYHEPKGSAAEGYNANIIEEMYIEEVKNFIDAVNRKETFSNSLEWDYQLLQILYGIEKSGNTGTSTKF